MENNTNMDPETSRVGTNFADEVKGFYRGQFKVILSEFFKNPIEGIHLIFKNPGEKAYINSIILFVSVFVVYFVALKLLMGGIGSYVGVGPFVKASLIPVIFMLIISILSYGLKSISGKPDFKGELLTGGLCGIPLTFFVISLFIFKLIYGDRLMGVFYNPVEAGLFFIIVIIYIMLMLINIMQQSLKSSGSKDALAWYLSPAAVFLSSYLTLEIAVSFARDSLNSLF